MSLCDAELPSKAVYCLYFSSSESISSNSEEEPKLLSFCRTVSAALLLLAPFLPVPFLLFAGADAVFLTDNDGAFRLAAELFLLSV